MLATGIRGNDLLIQGDGKIVIIGASVNTAFAVVRLNPDGSPDLTFDTDGVVTTAVGTGEAQAGRIMPDGKIVIAGHSGNNLNVVRYNANGSLDTTLSGDGIATLSLSNDLEL